MCYAELVYIHRETSSPTSTAALLDVVTHNVRVQLTYFDLNQHDQLRLANIVALAVLLPWWYHYQLLSWSSLSSQRRPRYQQLVEMVQRADLMMMIRSYNAVPFLHQLLHIASLQRAVDDHALAALVVVAVIAVVHESVMMVLMLQLLQAMMMPLADICCSYYEGQRTNGNEPPSRHNGRTDDAVWLSMERTEYAARK